MFSLSMTRLRQYAYQSSLAAAVILADNEHDAGGVTLYKPLLP